MYHELEFHLIRGDMNMFSLIPLLFLTPNVILIAAAVIPAIVLLIYVYKMDRLEKEPWPVIWRLVLLGAISTALAQLTENGGIAILPSLAEPGSKAYFAILCFVVVAVSEEGFKYLILKLRTWRSPYFNCRFDGVVYACAVSLGFSLWENIMYVTAYGFSTAIIRAITAIPGHACFGVFMGTFYGAAKQHEVYGAYGASKMCRVMAVAVPVLLHGTYDYLAMRDDQGLALVFFAFIAAMFFVAYKTVKKLSRTDRYL